MFSLSVSSCACQPSTSGRRCLAEQALGVASRHSLPKRQREGLSRRVQWGIPRLLPCWPAPPTLAAAVASSAAPSPDEGGPTTGPTPGPLDPAALAATAAAALRSAQPATPTSQPPSPDPPTAATSSSGQPAATALYTALAAAYCVAGLATAALSPTIATSCLTCPSTPQGLVTALVGCFAAALVRVGALFYHLKDGAQHRELHTWRYQRINLALAVAFGCAALLQPLSFGCAHPLLLLVATAAAGATATGCGALAWSQLQQGVVFASAVSQGPWGDRLQAAWVYLLHDGTSLAGFILLVVATVGVWGGAQGLLGLGLPQGVVLEPGVQYLRRMASLGLLLLSLHCHTLLEDASTARKLDPMTAVKESVILQAEEEEEQLRVAAGQLPAPQHVPTSRFVALQLGLFVSLAIQGVALVQGAAVGGPVGGALDLVNVDAALWGPLYWAVLAGLAYTWSLLATLDFGSLGRGLGRVMGLASGVLYGIAGVLFVDWIWVNDGYRE